MRTILANHFIHIALTLFVLIQVLVPSNIFSSIISLLFIFLIPGLSLTKIIRLETKSIWHLLILSVSLSILISYLIGLFINQFFSLSRNAFLVSIIGFETFLIFMAELTKSNLYFHLPSWHKPNRYSALYFVPFLILFLSICGTLLLNNSEGNRLQMIALVMIALFFMMVVLLIHKIPKNLPEVSLYLIGLSLILMFSLRSDYVIGFDVNQEYQVFQMTKQNLKWDIQNFRDPYNACLSITILPTIISQIVPIEDHYIYKLLYQFIFALVPVGIFLLVEKFSTKLIAYMCGFFFVSQVWFIQQVPAVVRQEIAFLFFIAILLEFFLVQRQKFLRYITVILLGFGMVLSHYSTTYVAITVFLFTAILFWIGKRFLKVITPYKQEITVPFAITLTLLALIWTNVITNTGGNTKEVISIALTEFGNSFNFDELREDPLNTIKSMSKNVIPQLNTPNQDALNDLYSDTTGFYKDKRSNYVYFSEETYANYVPELTSDMQISRQFGSVGQFTLMISSVAKISFTYLLPIVGMGYIIWSYRKNMSGHKLEFILLSVGSFSLMVLILIIPVLQRYYNSTRLYLQSLMYLSLPTVVGAYTLLKPLKSYSTVFVILALNLFFLTSSGFLFQLFGGSAYITLNNFGNDYDKFYTTKTEIYSANWLGKNYSKTYQIYADEIMAQKLAAYALVNTSNFDLFPSVIDQNAYVFLARTNYKNERVYKKFGADTITFKTPIDFLDQNKDKIYTNGESVIYK